MDIVQRLLKLEMQNKSFIASYCCIEMVYAILYDDFTQINQNVSSHYPEIYDK